MPLRITISKENYLKAIAEAESEGETVKAVTLVRWLGVSAPAVTMAIKRLRRDGLIQVGEEGQITLTAEGRDIANRLLNRHHLIERMLTEIFGLEWYKVHDEAEQLEHALRDAGVNDGPDSSVSSFETPAAAFQDALRRASENDRIVVFGSFYTVAGVMAYRRTQHN